MTGSLMDPPSNDPLRQAIRLGGVETERANKLFPDDEREAVYELLRRAKEFPDLRKALLFMCAHNLINGERMPTERRRQANKKCVFGFPRKTCDSEDRGER